MGRSWINRLAVVVLLFLHIPEISFAQGPPGSPKDRAKAKKQITLDDIWGVQTFKQNSVFGLRSMNDGIHYTTLDSKNGLSFIVRSKYETGVAVDTILRSDWLIIDKKDTLSIDDYHFSPDERKILIATGTEKIYRHSTREANYVWNRDKKKLMLLSKGAKQRYATFSPTGSKVAFVRENNLFVKDPEAGKEVQITTDGKWNHIINGSADWVYEEEFTFDKAFFWSVDGSKIAYYRFDESAVKEFTMAKYGSLYPVDYKFKYPKAGEENAVVSIHIYDLITKKVTAVDLGNDYEYIPRIKWTQDPNVLSVQRMNRHQNHLDLLLVDAATGTSNVILTEKRETYIDITDDLTFLKDNKRFIWTSDKDGFNHIYLYDLKGNQLEQITVGSWDLSSFDGIDESTGILFYTSAEGFKEEHKSVREYRGVDYQTHRLKVGSAQPSPLDRNVFAVDLTGTKKKLLSARNGTNSATFSKGFKYFINYHTDANSPSFITLHKINGDLIRILEANRKLNQTIDEYDITDLEFFHFKTSENIELNGWMIKPNNFDPNKKYPLLMYVYGGPGAQTVKNQLDRNYFWYQMLAQKGYIIASVDNRGTGARGADFKKCTYKDLGNLETVDQIEAAKYFGALDYIDASRIGIWGWSYGGYMTSLCLTKAAELFKMGIAVAPVTNWRYYDTIYTERFLQTPQENAKGYDDNSPINYVDKLEGKYLLVHGSADDNVHYQNTMEMVNALVNANKQFDLFIYPDKNHSIYGGNTRLHLFTKMTNYILENL